MLPGCARSLHVTINANWFLDSTLEEAQTLCDSTCNTCKVSTLRMWFVHTYGHIQAVGVTNCHIRNAGWHWKMPRLCVVIDRHRLKFIIDIQFQLPARKIFHDRQGLQTIFFFLQRQTCRHNNSCWSIVGMNTVGLTSRAGTWVILVWKHLHSINPLHNLLFLFRWNWVQCIQHIQPREAKEQEGHPGKHPW